MEEQSLFDDDNDDFVVLNEEASNSHLLPEDEGDDPDVLAADKLLEADDEDNNRLSVKLAPVTTGSSNTKKGVSSIGNKKERKKRGANAMKAVPGASAPGTDFDRAMERLKLKRRKKVVVSGAEAAKYVENILEKMKEAARNDQTRSEQGLPAYAKLALSDKVIEDIVKPVWTSWFLQEGLLAVLEQWLAPLPSGALPTLSLRFKLYNMLSKIEFAPEFAQGTGIGDRLVALWRHPEETDENKRLIRQVVLNMIRPILGSARHQPTNENQQQTMPSQFEGGKKYSGNPSSSMRANIPRFTARTFKIAPQSTIKRNF